MASDQSETSGGSRVRQFGLYRSIDSRTEEFLRLSRRRQMRQGCACAAVSTAITVTVIVGALLLFEYNVVSNEEIKSNVPNWHNLLNDTAEAMSLNTLKMLPIIIKELNKNKVDSASESATKRPIQEKRHTTEFSYKKNVFSNRKNWVRLPSSRIYAIEYKTPTIAYFKTPKNDYFTKIRKIRDYQRIINYVDKMISDRVAFGSTQPMQTTEEYAADDVQTQRIPSKKLARTPNESKELITSTRKPKTKGDSNKNCNCPNKIGDILNDLVSNIKLLVPHSSTIRGDMLMRPIGNDDFIPSANTHAHTGQVVKGLLNQNLKQRHKANPAIQTDKPFVESLSSLGYDKTDGKTVFGVFQQQFTGQKTYIFKGYLNNVTEAPQTFIEKTESYNPLHFIAPSYREEDKRNLSQKITSDRVLTTSTMKEQYAHLRDPLSFNANIQDDDDEDNMKNEDYKMPSEQVLSTPRLHFANNYPLHFIANTRDYDESSVKNNFKKMTSVRELSTSTQRITAMTPNDRIDDMKNNDKKVSLLDIIMTSTSKTYYAKKDPLRGAPNALDYEEDNKKNVAKEMSIDKTYEEGVEDDSKSARNGGDQIYLNPKSPFSNMNKTYYINHPHTHIKMNNMSPKQLLNLTKTTWHAQNMKPGYKNKFYPMITTHFLYHRHNISTKPPLKLDLIATTITTPISSAERTTSLTNINVDETTTSPFVETFNFTSDLIKTKNRGSDSPHNYQKFKDDTGFRFEELNLDDDFDKIINEDNYQEINEKDDFLSTVFSNLETQTKRNVATTSKVGQQTTTDSRDKEDVFYTSSVFHNKPRSYLEIQRNYLNDNENN